jgi:2-iminobutanoate/2-iminopropanoate deaminase
MEILHTESAPAAAGPYSQAVITENFVFTSGQLGIIPETGSLAEGIEAQSEQAIKNIGAILKKAGLDYGSAVKTTCYLKNMGDFPVFNKIYAEYFTGKPARSCAEVSNLPKGALVEIDVIAIR